MHLRVSLPNRLDAPRKARAAVTEIEPEVDPMVAAKTRLLVSELVTNATRHGDGQITVDVKTSPRGVRGSVTDQGDGFAPSSERDEILAESGRGLLLLRRLADSWGVAKGSTMVWFEVGARAGDRVPLGP